MAYWLLKTEPGTYGWSDLTRDKKTVWDGVSNALALKHIRAMKKGDLVLFYHTGDERQVVGVAEVASNAYADPKAKDDKRVVVDLKPRKALARPVTLAEFKSDPAFADWELLRISRLSVMPVPDAIWKRIDDMSKKE